MVEQVQAVHLLPFKDPVQLTENDNTILLIHSESKAKPEKELDIVEGKIIAEILSYHLPII